jgi:SAM-dependent methyltransferase
MLSGRTVVQARLDEVARYERVYQNPNYRLGDRRRCHITSHLNRIPKGSLLDVSTGRGEVLELAGHLGHGPVMGTEAVPALCDDVSVVHALGHDLPFPSARFDTVTMFDVMEHLLPEDTGAVCKELARVAADRVLLTVHNGPSVFGGEGDLHINRRSSYEEWHEELKQHFAPHEVVRHGLEGSISEMFEVVKCRSQTSTTPQR